MRHTGNDYVLASPLFHDADPAAAAAAAAGCAPTGGEASEAEAAEAGAEAERRRFCAALGRLAARMAAAARGLLEGSGIEPRVAVAAGPVFAAVVGDSRRHLRLLGGAAAAAAALCARAAPWEAVVAEGRAADALRWAGVPVGAAGAGPAGAVAVLVPTLVRRSSSVASAPPAPRPGRRPVDRFGVGSLAAVALEPTHVCWKLCADTVLKTAC